MSEKCSICKAMVENAGMYWIDYGVDNKHLCKIDGHLTGIQHNPGLQNSSPHRHYAIAYRNELFKYSVPQVTDHFYLPLDWPNNLLFAVRYYVEKLHLLRLKFEQVISVQTYESSPLHAKIELIDESASSGNFYEQYLSAMVMFENERSAKIEALKELEEEKKKRAETDKLRISFIQQAEAAEKAVKSIDAENTKMLEDLYRIVKEDMGIEFVNKAPTWEKIVEAIRSRYRAQKQLLESNIEVRTNYQRQLESLFEAAGIERHKYGEPPVDELLKKIGQMSKEKVDLEKKLDSLAYALRRFESLEEESDEMRARLQTLGVQRQDQSRTIDILRNDLRTSNKQNEKYWKMLEKLFYTFDVPLGGVNPEDVLIAKIKKSDDEKKELHHQYIWFRKNMEAMDVLDKAQLKKTMAERDQSQEELSQYKEKLFLAQKRYATYFLTLDKFLKILEPEWQEEKAFNSNEYLEKFKKVMAEKDQYRESVKKVCEAINVSFRLDWTPDELGLLVKKVHDNADTFEHDLRTIFNAMGLVWQYGEAPVGTAVNWIVAKRFNKV